MKANSKYTADEILRDLGYEPEEVIGKMRVRVGGLPINSLGHDVRFQPEVKSFDVVVGNKKHTVELSDPGKTIFVSTGAKEAIEEYSREASEKAVLLSDVKESIRMLHKKGHGEIAQKILDQYRSGELSHEEALAASDKAKEELLS